MVEDVGVMVGIDAQNEIVHEAPNLHLSILSPLVMPHLENTVLTSHIMESNDAAKISDNSLEYRFQFGGGDDDEITYARTIGLLSPMTAAHILENRHPAGLASLIDQDLG